MADWAIWFVLAFALLFVELMTGTFYVLMIALAAAAGGLAALFGLGTALQLVIAGAVGTAATLILRRSRFGRRAQKDPSTDPEQSLDIGQVVQVPAWNNGTARVVYRGTHWDAVLAPGEAETTGSLYIREVRGTRLTVSAHRA